MAWFDRIIGRSAPEKPATPAAPAEQRSIEDPNTPITASTLSEYLYGDIKTPIRVTEDSSMALSAVYACTRVLGETLGSLPGEVFEKNGANKTKLFDHPLYHLVHTEPNPLMTSMVFRETMETHVLLWGNGYAEIIRNGFGEPIELRIIEPWKLTPYLYNNLIYYMATDGRIITSDNILHVPGLGFDGIKGRSVIGWARENLSVGLAAQRFGANFFANGAHLGGVLETDALLNDKAYTRMLTSWRKANQGIDNVGNTPILEQGVKFNKIGIPPEDAQFLETRKFQVTEVARLFRVPPHLIADLERSTNNNIEHQGIEFVTHTMRPRCIRYEMEYNRKLFREDEKGKRFVEFNLEGLLRGDSTSRADLYGKLFSIGAINRDEIRSRENLNPVPGGDQYFVMSNMVPVDLIGEVFAKKPVSNGN